jgi:hypothetical protein
MNAAKNALLISLFKLQEGRNKHYSSPRVDALLGLMEKHHRKKIRRRWLFQCLRDTEDGGYVVRKKRYRKNEDGEVEQISSLWSFTLKGAQYLFKKCVSGAGNLVKRILQWLNKGDDRWPQPKESAPNIERAAIQGGMTKLKYILPGLLKAQ